MHTTTSEGHVKLRFTKMHGIGNDFVVVDATREPFALTAEQIRGIADRRFGVGCDQLLIVERGRADVDFKYRIFNADGGEVEQCGNGARCFARFVRDQGLTDKRVIAVETTSGRSVLTVEDDGEVSVDVAVPRFVPTEIPFVAEAEATTYTLEVAGKSFAIGAVSMGNPHAVMLVDDVDAAPVLELGRAMEHHPSFPSRVNAGFLQVVSPHEARLRVYERGAGETLACGTGACAAVVHGIERGVLQSPVRVQMRGGALTISWGGRGQAVRLRGPAERVFDGEYPL